MHRCDEYLDCHSMGFVLDDGRTEYNCNQDSCKYSKAVVPGPDGNYIHYGYTHDHPWPQYLNAISAENFDIDTDDKSKAWPYRVKLIGTKSDCCSDNDSDYTNDSIASRYAWTWVCDDDWRQCFVILPMMEVEGDTMSNYEGLGMYSQLKQICA